VADLDADGRDDVAVTTNTALKYWLTCGGGCPANHDGETWSPSANVLASFTLHDGVGYVGVYAALK
jgi:hypothetical protein